MLVFLLFCMKFEQVVVKVCRGNKINIYTYKNRVMYGAFTV